MSGDSGAADASGFVYGIVVLDAGPLSLTTHPRGGEEAGEAQRWLSGLLRAGVAVRVPEIADYEQRRELLRSGRHRGIERMDELTAMVGYLPITTPVMRRAARLWAQARNEGRPTAPPESLDADVILAAQALVLEEELESPVVVATTNPNHLSRYIAAADWRDIEPGESAPR